MTGRSTLARVLMLTGCLSACSLGLALASRSEPVPPRQALALFPLQLGEWKGGANVPFEPKVMQVLRLDDFLNREYRDTGGRPMALYVGYYATQRTGETAHSPLNCLPGNGWEPVKIGTLDLQVDQAGRARSIRISRYVVQKGIDRQIVLFWYQSHGRVMYNEYATKLFLMADAVRLNRTDGAIVRVVAPLNRTRPDEALAEERALSFVRTVFPHLNEYLPQ